MLFFFFFKQKTAYEFRISDWSSDVCSSDLPLVLELTGKRAPKTGLEGKFSVYHAAACALLRGDGAPTVFTDAVVSLPEVVALRDRVTAVADPGCHEAAVTIEVTFEDGSTLKKHVERAIGSRERPLSNE